MILIFDIVEGCPSICNPKRKPHQVLGCLLGLIVYTSMDRYIYSVLFEKGTFEICGLLVLRMILSLANPPRRLESRSGPEQYAYT